MQVLCATIHEGKIIVGCQYGLLVFWDLVQVVSHHQHHHHCHHEGAWYGEESGWTTPCYCCSLWAQVNSSDDDYDVQSSWYLLIIGDHLTKMFFLNWQQMIFPALPSRTSMSTPLSWSLMIMTGSSFSGLSQQLITNGHLYLIDIINIVVFQEPAKLPTVRSDVQTRRSRPENPFGKPVKQWTIGKAG